MLFTRVKAIFFREKNYDADRAQNFQQFRDNLKNHDSPLIDVFLGRSETTLQCSGSQPSGEQRLEMKITGGDNGCKCNYFHSTPLFFLKSLKRKRTPVLLLPMLPFSSREKTASPDRLENGHSGHLNVKYFSADSKIYA